MAQIGTDVVSAWLVKGGWHPERDIGDQADYLVKVRVDDARRQGFELMVSDAALQFIHSYGDLELPLRKSSPEALLMLDPTIGYEGDVEDFAELSSGLQRSIFPVGTETDEFGTWLIDELGRFFYRHNTGNYYLGSTAVEAFATMLSGGPYPYAEDYFV
ncbi:SUKH-3 domain-containing protein [Nocardia sp. NPDC004722]